MKNTRHLLLNGTIPYLYDKLVNKDYKTIGPRHAYSHVNTMSSAAKAYEVLGDEKYLTACKNAYDVMPRKTYLRHRRLRPG